MGIQSVIINKESVIYKILTSSTTGSTYISTVLLRGGRGIGMGEAAADERRDILLHEHCETDRREQGDSLRKYGK